MGPPVDLDLLVPGPIGRTRAIVMYRTLVIASRGTAVWLMLVAAAAHAQDAPDRPGGAPRVSIAGEVTGSVGPEDSGYFNYTDYRYSQLRLFTATLSGAVRLADRVDVLGQVRLQNDDMPSASGLYLRVRPWRSGPVTIQAGRIPPVFGRFSRRGYGRDNPLIGTPLAYQYLTTLRSTAVPLGADALLAVRGRGWRVIYPQHVGGDNSGPGLPVVSSVRWDTGVQGHVAGRGVEVAAALTNGSLSNPRVDDDNSGRQLAGRLTWQPVAPLNLGLSLSRGAFLAREVTDVLPADAADAGYVQQAVGVDAEVSAGYWVARGELIASRWTLPRIGSPAVSTPLQTTALTVEGRYRVKPGLHVAARGEHLAFSAVRGSAVGDGPTPWDAPVSRVEIGFGYAVTRHILTKVSYQYNWRVGVTRPRRTEGFLAAQVAAWF